jgi:hypothetical protein
VTFSDSGATRAHWVTLGRLRSCFSLCSIAFARFASEQLEFDVLTVGVIMECDGSEVHLSQGGAIRLEVFSKVNEVAEVALRCPGCLRCHS